MRLHRFIGPFDLAARDTLTITDPALINQWRNVLRLKTDGQIILCDGKGNEVIAEIRELSTSSANLAVLEYYQNRNEPPQHITLYCSILKRENFEWVSQKVTEVGVSVIVPVICMRTVKQSLKADRLRTIIKEAAEQSGRGSVPILHEPLMFEETLKDAVQRNEMNIFFDVNGTPLQGTSPGKAKTIGLFIGPEGGWEPDELEAAKKNSMRITNLGRLTLRAETAAIMGVYSMIAFSHG